MSIDPSVNVVVFQLATDDGLVERATSVPTQVDDPVQRAWTVVAQRDGANPDEVRQVYSEWEPSASDKAFMDATFPPHVEVSFSFPRPTTEDGWQAAFAQAEASIRETLNQQQPEAKLLPVLRDLDTFAEMVVYRPLTSDLGTFLAHVAWTPRQTIGIDYLMRSQLEGSPLTPDDAFRTAYENFIPGLQIQGGAVGEEKVITIRHEMDLGASALGLPDFLDNATKWLGSAEVFVAVPDPVTLYVTPYSDGPFATRMRQTVQMSNYYGAIALTPACYTLGPGGLRLIARRTVIA